MRTLHILDHSLPLQSGYTFRTRAILAEQRALGWESYHLTTPKQGAVVESIEEHDGLRFYRTPPGALAKWPILNQWDVVRASAKRLRQLIPEIKPDLLHAHSPALNGLAALDAARRFRLPLVYEVRAFWEDAAVDHGDCREGDLRYRLTRAMESHVLKRAQQVTTICEGLRSDIVARGLPPERVTVIPNAVDLKRFSELPRDQALAAELGLSEARVIGFIGSFYAYEGLDLLLQALARVRDRRPELRLLLVGGGPQEERLKALANQLGLNDRVLFTGRVPHAEVGRYYSLVDCFVYPRHSMRLTELVTPLKPLEAMAQGRLVLASDVGGHRELIKAGETGFLFRADDVEALAEALLDLLAREAEWSEVRQRAHQFVESERNWPVSVSRYAAVYARALEQRA